MLSQLHLRNWILLTILGFRLLGPREKKSTTLRGFPLGNQPPLDFSPWGTQPWLLRGHPPPNENFELIRTTPTRGFPAIKLLPLLTGNSTDHGCPHSQIDNIHLG